MNIWNVLSMSIHVLNHLLEAVKVKERISEGNARRGATARGVTKKNRDFGVIQGKKVRKDDPLKHLFPKKV